MAVALLLEAGGALIECPGPVPGAWGCPTEVPSAKSVPLKMVVMFS